MLSWEGHRRTTHVPTGIAEYSVFLLDVLRTPGTSLTTLDYAFTLPRNTSYRKTRDLSPETLIQSSSFKRGP